MKQLLAAFSSRIRRRAADDVPADGLELQLPDASDGELAIIREVRPFTMTSPERLLGLVRAVEHLERHNIPGSIVECGVWRGGSMMAVAHALLRSRRKEDIPGGEPDRPLWLFDTFEGMTRPESVDIDLRSRDAADQLALDRDPLAPDSPWCFSPLEEVRANLGSTGYPADALHFVPGPVEQTLPVADPGPIALLRLDTDWYRSTLVELEVLYPRLVQGGILIIDDYGHWQGCRRAVDDYFAREQVPIFLTRMDYTGRMGVKP